jgi:hypothetical protein
VTLFALGSRLFLIQLQINTHFQNLTSFPRTRITVCLPAQPSVCEVLDPPVSAFSLSLYRHPFLYTLFSSCFTLKYNKLEFSPDYPIPKIIQHKKKFLFRGRTQTKENGTCACCRNRTATPRLRRVSTLLCVPTLLCVLVYSCSVGDRTLASFISTVSNEDLRRGKHSVEILLGPTHAIRHM